jgi:predicted secreted hydrolase
VRRAHAALLGLLLSFAALAAEQPAAQVPAVVDPRYLLQFPRDYGSHPQFRIEWWYLTGWLTTTQHQRLGFQITFFRSRPSLDDSNPSAFTPHQILIAHCAISDPAHSGLWHDQRVRRAGMGLAEAQQSDTRIWIDDWRLEREDGVYRARLRAQDFALALDLSPDPAAIAQRRGRLQPEGSVSLADGSSYYYSQPHLRVERQRRARCARNDAVSGEAWLDHEWSSEYLDPLAAGWDWIGLNLDDGGAVMAFRIRDRQGQSFWSAGTVREPQGLVRNLGPEAIAFSARRRWRSARSGVTYPVSTLVRVGARQFELEPLLDDQENDTRLSSGTLYWEGAVSASENQRPVGRGYLELTGYDEPLSLR